MAGSRRWLRAMRGEECKVCGQKVTEFAVRELRFELLPRPNEPGYAALKTTMTAHCPCCGNAWEQVTEGIKVADMKSGIGWLADRTRRIVNPFTKQPINPAEAMDDGGTCACEFDEEDEQDSIDDDEDEEDVPSDVDSSVATDEPTTPPPRHRHRGRLLTQPSIRGCCPPSPITDGTVAAARRVLRCYSDRRTAASFPRLMARFGARVDTRGNPIQKEDGDGHC